MKETQELWMRRVPSWHISIPLCKWNSSDFLLIFIYSLFLSSDCSQDVRHNKVHHSVEMPVRRKGLYCNRVNILCIVHVLFDILPEQTCCVLIVFAVIEVDRCLFISCSERWLPLPWCGHKGVALTQLFEPFSRRPSTRTNCLWCNWGLRPLRKAYIGLNVEMFKEQWISISGCKIVFGASPAC